MQQHTGKRVPSVASACSLVWCNVAHMRPTFSSAAYLFERFEFLNCATQLGLSFCMPCCLPSLPAPPPLLPRSPNRMGTRQNAGTVTIIQNAFTVPCTAMGTMFLRVRSQIAGNDPFRGYNYFANVDATCAAASCECLQSLVLPGHCGHTHAHAHGAPEACKPTCQPVRGWPPCGRLAAVHLCTCGGWQSLLMLLWILTRCDQ